MRFHQIANNLDKKRFYRYWPVLKKTVLRSRPETFVAEDSGSPPDVLRAHQWHDRNAPDPLAVERGRAAVVWLMNRASITLRKAWPFKRSHSRNTSAGIPLFGFLVCF